MFIKSLGLCLGWGLLASLAMATYAVADAPRSIDVPAGELAVALDTLSKQSDIEIVYRRDQLHGIRTQGVKGELSTQEAVRKLLEGTRVRVRTDETTGAMLISVANAPVKTSENAQDGDLRLAQAQEMQKVENTDSEDVSSESEGSGSGAIPEILVRGKKNRSMNAEIKRDQDDVQPYIVFDAKAIQRSGLSDIESFLRQRLTGNNSNPSASQSFGSTGNATSFNLRGLDTDETLILVNGRRVASIGFGGAPVQPDIGGIPLAAIERIEVLGSTASGIFGGGATGGVINIVLKQAYTGLDVTAMVENPVNSSAPVRKFGLSGGLSPNGGRTSIMLTGAYSEASPLYVRDRDYAEAARQLAIQNDRAGFYGRTSPPLGATTNIRSSNGSPLQLKPQYAVNGVTLLSANGTQFPHITHVPVGSTGTYVGSSLFQGLINNAGSYNLDLADTAQGSGQNRSLLNNPTTKSLGTTIRHRITDRIDAFGEFSISQNLGHFELNPNSGTFFLPANAPTNPFAQAITVTTSVLGQDSLAYSKITNRRALAGVAINLTKNWHAEAEYSWSSSRFFTSSPNGLPASASAFVTTGAIDLTRDSAVNPVDFSGFPIGLQGSLPSTTILKNPAIRVGGLLPWGLPGGTPSLSGLVEYRRLDMGDSYFYSNGVPISFNPSRWQSTESVYLESRVPVFSERNALSGLKLLEIQLAGRKDRYKTEAANFVPIVNNAPATQTLRTRASLSSTDPTVGFRYKPVNSLTLRASYATGFLPPSVNQLVPGAPGTTTLPITSTIVDPRRGSESLGGRQLTLLNGGNPDLEPESAKSWTVGFILAPVAIPDLRLSVDRTRIDKTNNIGTLLFQDLINNEASFPDRIVRADPTPQNDPNGFGVGPIIQLNQLLINVAKTEIEAVDVALDYRLRTDSLGELTFSVKGTRTVHNIAQVSPIATPTERVGLVTSNLRWNGNASLVWERNSWSAGWEAQYFDKYWIATNRSFNTFQGSSTIPSQLYHDVFFSYGNAGRSGGKGEWWREDSLLSNLSVQIGVENVLNMRPPIIATEEVGYSRLADPRRARYYVNIQKHFGGGN